MKDERQVAPPGSAAHRFPARPGAGSGRDTGLVWEGRCRASPRPPGLGPRLKGPGGPRPSPQPWPLASVQSRHSPARESRLEPRLHLEQGDPTIRIVAGSWQRRDSLGCWEISEMPLKEGLGLL